MLASRPRARAWRAASSLAFRVRVVKPSRVTQTRLDGRLQRVDALLVVPVVIGVAHDLPLGRAQGMDGHRFTALQIVNVELSALFTDTDTPLLVGHGNRVFVGLPRDQTGLVDLALHTVVVATRDTAWCQIRTQVSALVGIKPDAGRLTGGAVSADVGHLVQPLLQVGAQLGFIAESLAIQRVLLDVLHPGFDFAFALRVIAAARLYPQAGGRRVFVETLIDGELTELLGNDHHLGLVIHTLLRHAAEVAEGLIVQADEAGRVQRREADADVAQPRVREDEHHEMHRPWLAADQHPTQLARIDLTLHARHHVQHRFVVPALATGDGGLHLSDIAAQGALGHRQITDLLAQLASDLDAA